MNKKIIMVIILVIIAVLLLVGLFSGLFKVPSAPKDLTIGFINPDKQVFMYSEFESQLTNEIKQAGWTLTALNCGGDNSALPSYAESLIANQTDIAIAFNNTSRFPSDAAELFTQASVPFIVLENPLEGATYCGYDHKKTGELLGEKLAQSASEILKGADLIVTVQSFDASFAQSQRMNAALEKLKEKTNINDDFVASAISSDNQELSAEQIQDIFSKSPSLEKVIILCASDFDAEAALLAVSNAGYEKKTVIGSFSSSEVELGDVWVCNAVLSDEQIIAKLLELVPHVASRKNASDTFLEPAIQLN